jgi:hypothetical protein
MGILGDEQGVDFAVGKGGVGDAGGLADYGQGTARAGFGLGGGGLGEAGLEDFGDVVLEQHTAQGRPSFEFAKERVGQVEGGPHKNIFMRKCLAGQGW